MRPPLPWHWGTLSGLPVPIHIGGSSRYRAVLLGHLQKQSTGPRVLVRLRAAPTRSQRARGQIHRMETALRKR